MPTEATTKSYSRVVEDQEPIRARESTITADFLKDLVREVKEGFSAQARQLNHLMWTVNKHEINPPMKPIFGEYHGQMIPDVSPLPNGMIHQPMYQYAHPSQGLSY